MIEKFPASNESRLAELLVQLRTEASAELYMMLLGLPSFHALFNKFNQFLHSQKSPLALFWISYMDMVSLLLSFIRATREGNWTDHLLSVAKLIPWMFAYDRTNYSRYLTLYWC